MKASPAPVLSTTFTLNAGTSHFPSARNERALGAHGDGDDLGAQCQQFGCDLFVVGFARYLAGGGFARFQDVDQAQRRD